MKYDQIGGYGSVPEKKKHPFLIILIFIIFILGIGGFLYYKFIYSANYIKFFLDSTFKYLEEYVDNNNYDSLVTDFKVQMDFTSSNKEDDRVFDVINNIDFSGSYGIDYDKNIMNLEFYSDYDDKDLIDINLYTEYGRGFIYLNNLYDKYIDYPISDYNDYFDNNQKAYKDLIRGLKKALLKALRDEYFIIENGKIRKTILDLTGKRYYTFTKDFYNTLLGDKLFLESYANILGEDVADIKAEFREYIDSSKEYDGEKIILYTNKVNFEKIEIYSFDNKLLMFLKNNNGVYQYQLNENDGSMSVYGDIECIENSDKSNKILFSFYDNEGDGIDLSMDFSVRKNADVSRKDVNNSISYEKLNQSDLINIYSKLLNNQGIIEIINEFSKLSKMEDNNYLPMIKG